MLISDYADLKRRPLFHYYLFLFIICLLSFQSSTSLAQTNNEQYDDELVITPIEKYCSTVRPIATYSLKNGELDGVLFATVCRDGGRLPNPLVDYVKYKFIDTSGSSSERCFGIVDTDVPSGIRYSWEYLGAVPGYSCSKTNQTIHRLYPKGY